MGRHRNPPVLLARQQTIIVVLASTLGVIRESHYWHSLRPIQFLGLYHSRITAWIPEEYGRIFMHGDGGHHWRMGGYFTLGKHGHRWK